MSLLVRVAGVFVDGTPASASLLKTEGGTKAFGLDQHQAELIAVFAGPVRRHRADEAA